MRIRKDILDDYLGLKELIAQQLDNGFYNTIFKFDAQLKLFPDNEVKNEMIRIHKGLVDSFFNILKEHGMSDIFVPGVIDEYINLSSGNFKGNEEAEVNFYVSLIWLMKTNDNLRGCKYVPGLQFNQENIKEEMRIHYNSTKEYGEQLFELETEDIADILNAPYITPIIQANIAINLIFEFKGAIENNRKLNIPPSIEFSNIFSVSSQHTQIIGWLESKRILCGNTFRLDPKEFVFLLLTLWHRGCINKKPKGAWISRLMKDFNISLSQQQVNNIIRENENTDFSRKEYNPFFFGLPEFS